VAGCAGTLPVAYQPQNFVRYEGQADVGQFTYVPAKNGNVAPNQIENTAVGSVYISADVADFVRRATALELEKTGVALSDRSPVQVYGDVLRFKIGDLGYSIDWTYCVRYRVTRKTDARDVVNAVYKVEKKTGKFGLAADYTPSVNELILTAYDQFIRDERTRKVLAASAEDLKSAPPAAASPAAPGCILDPPQSTVPAKLAQCESTQDCTDGGICFAGFCRH
jgi:hypothetical protein